MKPWWTAVAFTGLLVACSGGTFPIDVDGPGPGNGESQGPSADGVELPPPVKGGNTSSGMTSSGMTSSSSSSSSGGSSSSSSSSSGGTCQGCADFLSGTMVTTPCDAAPKSPTTTEISTALFGCGCQTCTMECMSTLCMSTVPVDATCAACLAGQCAAEYSACNADLGM